MGLTDEETPARTGADPVVEKTSAKKPVHMNAFLGAPKKVKFTGRNTSKFLKTFDLACDATGATDEDRCLQLALYLPRTEQEILKKKKAWKERDWERVKEIMLDEFEDEEENRWSPVDMEDCAEKARRKGVKTVNDFVRYHRRFRRITDSLKEKDIISHQEESTIFLTGLSKALRKRYEDLRSRRRLDSKLVAPGAPKTDTEKEDEDAPLVRRQLRTTALHRVIPPLKDIAKDVTAILRDDELYRGSRRSRHHRYHSSDSDSSSEDDSDSSDSDTDTSADESSSSSDSDSDSDGRKKGRKGRKEKKGKSGKKDKKGKKEKKTEKKGKKADTSTPAPSEGSMSELARQFGDQLKIFASGFQAQQQQPPYPPQAPYQRPQYAPYVPSGPYTSNTTAGPYATANGTPTTRPTLQPYGCHTCGSRTHGFKDSHLCEPMKDFLARGIVSQDARGNYAYRDQGRFPMSGDIQEPNFKLWVENQEAARARSSAPEGAKNTRFAEVNVTEYHHQAQEPSAQAWAGYTSTLHKSGTIRDWGSESDLEDDGHYQVEAKRARIAETGSSQNSAPAVKRPDTRSAEARRKENQDVAAKGNTFLAPTPIKVTSPASAAATSARSDDDEVMTEATVRRKATHHLKNQLEGRHTKDSVVTKLLDTGISMPLGMLLASSPDLAKALVKMCQRRRVPLPDDKETVVYNGNLAQFPEYILPDGTILEAHAGETTSVSYSHPLGRLSLSISGKDVEGLVDCGSMICLISEAFRKRAGLTAIKRSGDTIRGIGGESSSLGGICENVPVTIGGVVTHQHFFVSEKTSVDILLGLPFLVSVQAQLNYSPSGSANLLMKIGSKTLDATLNRIGSAQKKLHNDVDDWNTGDWQGNVSERAAPKLVSA